MVLGGWAALATLMEQQSWTYLAPRSSPFTMKKMQATSTTHCALDTKSTPFLSSRNDYEKSMNCYYQRSKNFLRKYLQRQSAFFILKLFISSITYDKIVRFNCNHINTYYTINSSEDPVNF